MGFLHTPTEDRNVLDYISRPFGLLLYIKDPNNKICKEWAERLNLGHRTVVSHGVHGGRTHVNHVCPRSLSPRHGLGGSGSWPFSQPPF